MPIIGTAGHVDHGKSTLVEALTGRDPDRWVEEKERGLTIDLGFAWARLGDETVGFVDVPGHERFIKNMLAGVGGLDVSLFVVAADEGWMPQSEEHLAVLDLLEVSHGVVALTRIDLADDDLVELSTIDIAEHVAGTVAESWPVVEVSAMTGAGMDDLAASLMAALASAGSPRNLGRPRMWIDRAFGIAGAGVVVTGTLVDGSFTLGDRLQCFPGGPVRLRGMQSHETDHETLEPGTRTAANLVGIDRSDLERGTLLAPPDSIGMTDRFLARLRFPPRSEDELSDRGSYHVHLGTATVPARIRILKDQTIPAAVVATTAPIPLTMGDRFILRDTGRQHIVAGGTILDPKPSRRPSAGDVATLSAAVFGIPSDRADALIAVHGSIDVGDLHRSSGGGTPSSVIAIGSTYFSPATFKQRGRELTAVIDDYHDRYPLRPGLPKSEASSRLGGNADLVTMLADAFPDLTEEGPVLRRPSFAPELNAADTAQWEATRSLLADDLAVPRASNLEISAEVLHALLRRGDLVRIDDDLVLLPDQVEMVTSGLPALPDGFTVAAFRDEFGLARRHAVPLLEWLDTHGWTRRDGDGRSIRR
ncbi:MAG: selenocysteine-specific translation elongation factor [Actinomycetota bacterium]|nr:selenocysteine-specific translation elongation factor [Actinomycetota bacterium]